MKIHDLIRNTTTDNDRYHYCEWCHEAFIPKRRDAKTCSQACKQAIYRWRKRYDIRWYETATERQLRQWRQESGGRVTDKVGRS